MIQNDTIEVIKQATYTRHNTEDGVWDIMLGFGMVLLAFCYLTHMFSYFAFYGAFGPMIAKGLRRTYVYPRIGVVLFRKYPKTHYQRVIMGALYIVFISMLGVVFTLYTKKSPIISFSYSYPWAFVILMMFIGGGIRQESKHYLFGFMACIPLYFTHLFNTNTYYRVSSLVLLIVTVFAMERLAKKDVAKKQKPVKQRYAQFEHYMVVFMAILVGIYLVLNREHSPLAHEIRNFVIMNSSFVIGNFIAFLLLIVGFAFYSYRFILYALLLSVALFLPYLVVSLKNSLMQMLLALGFMIIAIGFLHLIRFTKKYPLIEVSDER
jgi:hypothetical protein